MAVFKGIGLIKDNAKTFAYVLDSETLAIKDLLEFDDYEFSVDTEFSNKSTIVTAVMPNIEHDDFVLCQCAGTTVFAGICENYASDSEKESYKITLKQKENLFDRFIFISNEALIASTGIEDFIAAAITENWISSGDAMLDRAYITVTAATHTPIAAKVSTTVSLTDGAYNLKTYLGNALEYYGIYLSFEFTSDNKLNISVYKDTAGSASIDVLLTDVSGYEETYAIDALTKLNVLWNETDGQDVIDTHSRTYYLLADRTITTDPTDPDRALGSTKAMVIDAETEAEMYQAVVDEFAGNSYKHKIEFDLFMDSRLYDYRDFYAGRNAEIKTKSGLRNSLVTAQSVSSGSRFANIIFGKLKVTLIEKIRGKA